MSEEWFDVVDDEDLVVGKAFRVVLDEDQILLVRTAGGHFAIGNQCTHQGAPLDKGVVRIAGSVKTVTCPAHGSMFRLDDGRVMRPPATKPVQAYDVKVEDGRVWVRSRGSN
jgi:nitrite reductase/ring-hydroxylating ferredoxin subunit